MERKLKQFEQETNRKWQTWLVCNNFIPDAGSCPDRLASGVGVPPDENKRPDHSKKDIKESMSGNSI